MFRHYKHVAIMITVVVLAAMNEKRNKNTSMDSRNADNMNDVLSPDSQR